MANVLMVVAQNGFRDEELLVPREMLEHAGHTIRIASKTRSKASGKLGATVMPDFAVHEVNIDYFDAIVIVGGPGATSFKDDKDVLDLIRDATEKNKLVTAICIAPTALAAAGILKGKAATVFPDRGAVKLLMQSGARYSEKNVVVDGSIITADGPQSAGEFGKAVIEALARKQQD